MKLPRNEKSDRYNPLKHTSTSVMYTANPMMMMRLWIVLHLFTFFGSGILHIGSIIGKKVEKLY